MTTVSPYARVNLTDRVSAWSLVGYGTGDIPALMRIECRVRPPDCRQALPDLPGEFRGAIPAGKLELKQPPGHDPAPS